MSDRHFTPTHPRAQKDHKCIACWHTIHMGERHVMQEGFFEGEPYRNRYHNECWDDLSEEGTFEFSPGCLEPPERLTA